MWVIKYSDGTLLDSRKCKFSELPRDKEVEWLKLVTPSGEYTLYSPDKKFRFFYQKIGHLNFITFKQQTVGEEIGMLLEDNLYEVVDSFGRRYRVRKSPIFKKIHNLNV